MNDQKPMNTIAKAAIIILFGTIFIKLLTYVFRIIIARTGVENYGLISLGLAVYGVISVICIFGMDTGLYGLLSRTIQKEEEKAKEFIVSAVKISLALSLILSFLLFILSDWLALTYFHNENLKIIIQIIAISIPFGVFRSIIQTTLRSFQLVKLDTAIRIFENITKLIIVIILLYFGLGVIGIALSYTLSIFLSFLLALFFLEKRILSVWPRRNTSMINKDLLNYSWPLLLNNISTLIFNWTDTIMLGIFQNTTQVGLFNTAAPTASLLSIVNKSIMTIFLPVTTKIYLQENKEEFKKIFRTTIRWILLINSFGLVLILLFSKEILSIFFGQEYGIAYSALIILAIFFMIGATSDVPREILLMIKKTKTIWYVTLGGILGNILLNYLLIPKWGIIGAAIGTGSGFFITTILFFSMVYKETKLFPFDWNHFRIILAILSTISIMFIIKKQFTTDIKTTIFLSTLTIFIHAGLLFLLRCIKKEEKDILKAGIQKLRSHTI
ncbi:flippase [Candidatus Woesearchaeota archaeon]|nr:flippase [Candidatus Woesearchaeota archaeon]